MDIKRLHKEFENCPCGKVHTCPIDFIEIGKGAISSVTEIAKEYNSILLISDPNTYAVAGKRIEELLCEKVEKSLILTPQEKVVIPNEEKIEEIEKSITDKTDFIIGVGSGVINDLCKYTSFKAGLFYAIVATAPSMDGYASVGSALILEGMKVTLNARPPKAIIGDGDVLKTAPLDMISAGYGDIIGKYSCLNDWKLSAFINGEHFCDKTYDLTMDCVKRVEPMAKALMSRDADTVADLFEALVLVGVAMSFTGSSRPASGSEHHLSHFFEITGILDGKDYLPHGIDVAFSTIETAKLRERIIISRPKFTPFDKKAWEKDIREIYKTSADGVIALQEKLGWYENVDTDKVMKNFDKIKEILSEVPPSDRFVEMTEGVGLYYKDFVNTYGEEKIEKSLLYAKDLKDRYTVLWLYYHYFR